MDAETSASILGTAVVMIRGDTSRLPADLKNAGQEIQKGFSIAQTIGGLADIGKVALMAYAPLKLIHGAIGLIKENWRENTEAGIREAEEMGGAVKRLKTSLDVLNTTGLSPGDMIDQANAINKATGVGAAGIVQFQGELTKFQNVQGEIFKRATKVAVDYSEVTGRSLPAAANMLGRALNDPAQGMAALRRAGIQLTDSQQTLIKALSQSGKVAEAQEMLMGALEKRYGGAGSKMASSVKMLKSELSNIQEEIGKIHKQREPATLRFKIMFAEIQKGAMQVAADVHKGDDFNPQIGKGERTWWDGAKEIGGAAGGAVSGLFSGYGRNLLSGGGYLGGIKEREYLEKQQAIIDERRAKKKAEDERPELEASRKKLKSEGIFDPMALSKRLQEEQLSKDDQMIGLMEENNSLQEKMLEQGAGGSQSDPVIGPR